MTPSVKDDLADQQQDVRPISSDEMKSVSGGFLPIPPIDGRPVPTPVLPVARVLPRPGLGIEQRSRRTAPAPAIL
jgi:hypothetical protein